MKKILFSLLPVAALALITISPVSDPLPIGSNLPNGSQVMKDISGEDVSFKHAMKKNGLLVMFSCNTCPVVHKYESRTVAVAKEALDQNVGVILLNPNEAYRERGDSYDEMKDYAKKLGYNFYYAVDQNSVMADAFGATRTPECFLFDKNGKLVYHGAIDDNAGSASSATPYLSKAISNLVKGQKIDPEKSKSVGCTIKRN
jgi:thioredoxin-related protein